MVKSIMTGKPHQPSFLVWVVKHAALITLLNAGMYGSLWAILVITTKLIPAE